MASELFSIKSPKVDGMSREEWRGLIPWAQTALYDGLERCRTRVEIEDMLHRLMTRGSRFEMAFWTQMICMELAARVRP